MARRFKLFLRVALIFYLGCVYVPLACGGENESAKPPVGNGSVENRQAILRQMKSLAQSLEKMPAPPEMNKLAELPFEGLDGEFHEGQ
ncbi:MAG: hypothetical protein NC930_04310 [Candidatus Omnitrophica bacterium]|nr:hypothetical protein [Candidatus Omnitrophota bacterium]